MPEFAPNLESPVILPSSKSVEQQSSNLKVRAGVEYRFGSDTQSLVEPMTFDGFQKRRT